MKAKILAFVAFTFLTQITYAQKVMLDHTHSVHNYKHPNKAEYMKKQQQYLSPTNRIEEIKSTHNKTGNSLTADANYKNMSANEAKIKQFQNSSNSNFRLAPHDSTVIGNYKSQFHKRPKNAAAKPLQAIDIPVATN